MNKLHLIYTPVTGVGLHGGFRGDVWFKHRIEIFKNYTLKSMLNQSNKNFIHWLSFRYEEQYNPLTKELFNYLKSINYPIIFTFDGLMYWDDKFTEYTLKSAFWNLLMMVRDCWIYKEWKNPLTIWKYTWEDKNKTLLQRLTYVLEKFKRDFTGYDWVYMTRIDSDDMFHKDTIDLIQGQDPTSQEALVFDQGYIYNVKTGQLADWNPPTNPPFHTLIFYNWTFFDPVKHLEFYKDFHTHEDITRIFKYKILDINKYMVSYHGKQINTTWNTSLARKLYYDYKYKPKGYCYTTSGKNISTHWESRAGHLNFMIGKEYFGEEKELILKDFGIHD